MSPRRRADDGLQDEESLTQLLLNGGNIPQDLSGQDLIRPDDQAIDYENEDELADEEDEEEVQPTDDEEPELQNVDSIRKHPYSTGSDLTKNHQFNEPDDHGFDFDIVGEDAGEIFGDHQNLHPNEEDWRLAFADDQGDHHMEKDGVDKHIEHLNNNHMSPGTLADNFGPEIFGLDDLGLDLSHQNAAMAGPDMTAEVDEVDILKLYYPDFEKGRLLSMNKLFGAKPSKLVLAKATFRAVCTPSKFGLEFEPDQRLTFKSSETRLNDISSTPKVSHAPNVVSISTDDYLLTDEKNAIQRRDDGAEEFASLYEWNFEDSMQQVPGLESAAHRQSPIKRGSSWMLRNISEIVDDEHSDTLTLDMNDEHLLFLQRAQVKRRKLIPRRQGMPLSSLRRYNISNDRAYDMLKENYQNKIRSTIGNLNIEHSLVALRLQSPHYKVRLSKAQKRSFHRPSFIAKPDLTIQFSKIKQRRRKDYKGKPASQLLRKTGDLTLGDNINMFLTEYCEEFPNMLNNLGMSSKLVNYYRKKSQDDNSRPKLEVGETHILGVQDRSAFWNFGFVEPGNIVPTLYNNMIRAPVFKHESPKTDFLMIRRSGGKKSYQQYFLRPLDHLMVVGQTFPVETVPGPHSRKVTTASKNRLKMIVYRVLNKSEHHRLQVKDISPHFPDQNDMQNRQRLKEFMEYQRSGPDQGFWKIKSNEALPAEDAIRSMVTPEQVALLDSMQVGEQHLEDAGYGKSVDEEDEEDAEGGTLEEQLAPWQITRNFVYATQGKAMLQLHGPGDPSGRGEGFSFLRTSMKGGFKAMGESVNDKLSNSKLLNGHSYNVAQQQQAYDAEIKRIWYTQKKSLSVTRRPDEWDDVEAERDAEHGESYPGQTPGSFSAADHQQDEDDMSLFSHASTTTSKQQKILRITRKVKDANGIFQRKIEIIRDPTVIRAYVKRRQMIEESQLEVDEMQVTNDESKNKRYLKHLELYLARLQRNKERREARQQQKRINSSSGDGQAKEKRTNRKCATCGAVGHIRTNKSCPMYKETMVDKA